MSENEAGPSGAGDAETSLPKATVAKLIAEYLPEGLACAKEARELVAECAREFIIMVSSEAHEICERGPKKTMMPEHVVEALKTLKLDKYVDTVEEASTAHKQTTKERAKKSSNKFNQQGLSQEELEEQQQAMLDAAARRYASTQDGGSAGAPVGGGIPLSALLNARGPGEEQDEDSKDED